MGVPPRCYPASARCQFLCSPTQRHYTSLTVRSQFAHGSLTVRACSCPSPPVLPLARHTGNCRCRRLPRVVLYGEVVEGLRAIGVQAEEGELSSLVEGLGRTGFLEVDFLQAQLEHLEAVAVEEQAHIKTQRAKIATLRKAARAAQQAAREAGGDDDTDQAARAQLEERLRAAQAAADAFAAEREKAAAAKDEAKAAAAAKAKQDADAARLEKERIAKKKKEAMESRIQEKRAGAAATSAKPASPNPNGAPPADGPDTGVVEAA